MQPKELLKEALALHQKNRFDEADALYREFVAVEPENADGWHFYGISKYQTGALEEALVLLNRAIDIDDSVSAYHNNLSNTLQLMGRDAEAEVALMRAIELEPDHPDAYGNLGALLNAQGRYEAALSVLMKSLALNPENPDTLVVLGPVLQANGRLKEAEQALVKALTLRPDFPEAMINLGPVLQAQGRLKEAVVILQRAIDLDDTRPETFNNIGSVLCDMGHLDRAESVLRIALSERPAYVEAMINLSDVLNKRLHRPEAEEMVRKALSLNAENPVAWHYLGEVLRDRDKIPEAIEAWRKALVINPQLGEAHFALGSVLAGTGDVPMAISHYREALKTLTGEPARRAHDALLMALHYVPGPGRQEIFEEHIKWGERYFPETVQRPPLNNPDPDRKLRIGIVSADFRNFAAAHFFLEALKVRPREQWDVFLYASVVKPDTFTQAFHETADRWVDALNLSDDELAAIISEDRIDILIDLDGHTMGNRLGVFARRPAPVQVNWLDYVDTTGLAAMDYLICDDIQTPQAEDHFYIEEVIRMPDDCMCFIPPEYTPDVSPLPASRKHFVTFGCFNSVLKIGTEVVETWAEILNRVEGSRLLINTPEMRLDLVRKRYLEMFEARGIDGERIMLWPGARHEVFYQQHEEIDIALDPFPYSGGLTTCEALWMGVPVVTFPGDRFCSRHAASHLTVGGFGERLVARDRQGYIDLAVELSQDLSALAELRNALRPTLKSSPLCNKERFIGNFTRVMRDIWRRACEEEKA